MAPSPASVQLKETKQSGLMILDKDQHSISFGPGKSKESDALKVDLNNVGNLQKTKDTAPRPMLKFIMKDPGTSYTFIFNTNEEAKQYLDEISDVLRELKQVEIATKASMDGQSAAMTIASTITGGKRKVELWEDDERLLADYQLQSELMGANTTIQKTFDEAMKDKPSSLAITQFTREFWRSRLPLLRAHALARTNLPGKTNILVEVEKARNSGSSFNLRGEVVKELHAAYPLIGTVYNDLVPSKIKTAAEFWGRFLQTRLYLKLRGMKLKSDDLEDKLFDRYLDRPELSGLRAGQPNTHISKFIDLEGNEENHSQRQGNMEKHDELRSSLLSNAPAVRNWNEMSRRLMGGVKASDTDMSAPIGMNEADYNELRLRDLETNPEQQRLILNIRDQSRFFAEAQSSKKGSTNPFANVDPTKAVQQVYNDIKSHYPKPGSGVIDIPFHEQNNEYDEDDDIETEAPLGSDTAISHITSLIQTHRDQTSSINETSHLPDDIYNDLILTHATTTEFLRQFWKAFLSGDPSQAHNVQALAESLQGSITRINAIAERAEAVRKASIRQYEADAETLYRKTGRRRKVEYSAIKGGEQAVRELLATVVGSLETALEKYSVAFDEQSKEREGGDDGE